MHSDAFYTTLCNALDLTSYVFPVTFADKELDKKLPPHEFRNHEDEAIYNLCKMRLARSVLAEILTARCRRS